MIRDNLSNFKKFWKDTEEIQILRVSTPVTAEKIVAAVFLESLNHFLRRVFKAIFDEAVNVEDCWFLLIEVGIVVDFFEIFCAVHVSNFI